MHRFIEQILSKIDTSEGLSEQSIARLCASLNYDKDTLLGIVAKIKAKKRIQVKFWINNQDGSTFGKGNIELIALIDKLGSISSAAKALGYSYKKAWDKITTIETELGQSIFIKQKGAGKQGGTKLNQTGKNLLKSFIDFETNLYEDAIRHYDKHLKQFFKEKQ